MDDLAADTDLTLLVQSIDQRLTHQTNLLSQLVSRVEDLVRDQAELRTQLTDGIGRGDAICNDVASLNPVAISVQSEPIGQGAEPATNSISERMRSDWNERAREDAYWYIAGDAVAGRVRDEAHFVEMGIRDVDRVLSAIDGAWLTLARALEIGCGAGRMTEFLLPRVAALTAIDVSTEMIELATQRLGNRPNLKLLATSGADLAPFGTASFDLVVSYVVFQHIPKSVVRQYFGEVHRVLQPGGIFRAQVARITDPAFVQPFDTDTFSMRSWTPDEVAVELAHWDRADIEVLTINDTTEHIWLTAYR